MMAMQGGDVVGLVAVIFGAVKLAQSHIAAAIAERIRGRHATAPHAELFAEVDQMRTRVSEVEERLDFAERLLSRAREAEHLPGGTQR